MVRFFGSTAAVLLLLTAGWQGALAQGASQACGNLEGQLAALDRQGASPDQIRRLQDAVVRQQYELDRTVAAARSMNCSGGFLFGPPPPPQCREINARLPAMQQNLERLSNDLQRARSGDGGREGRRRDLILALAQNRCGAQYEQAAARMAPRRSQGLFGLLFGGRDAGDEEPSAPITPAPAAPQHASTFRTVCVRLCDGFFFPISYAASPARFGQDENVCRRTCPGTEAELFAYPSPGGAIDQATSPSGEPYAQLPNAFRYRREVVRDCSCKPANMSWAEALKGADDDIRRGDIVVDDAKARQLSLPGQARPPAGRPAAPRSAPIVSDSAAVRGPPADLNAPPPPPSRRRPPPPGVGSPLY
jgi:hypothetical protein